MIDTHAHLDFEDFDQDREEVISRAFDNGSRLRQGYGGQVKAIINVGVDLERSRKSIEIAEKHEGVFASVGLHPDFFSKLPENFSKVRPFPFSSEALGIPQGQTLKNSSRSNLFEKLEKLAKNKKVVAIGETGLDYFHITQNMERGTQDPSVPTLRQDTSSCKGEENVERIKQEQKEGFVAQIKLAEKLDLPVIVHCRNAWEDLFEIVSRYEFHVMRFVLHCYSGDRSDTEKFLKLPNVFFSFSGNITYPKPVDRAEKLADALRKIPIEKIMLDSDSPFLSPQAFRGKRNEPGYVKFIAEKIAELKGMSVEEVERTTDENAEEFFRLAL